MSEVQSHVVLEDRESGSVAVFDFSRADAHLAVMTSNFEGDSFDAGVLVARGWVRLDLGAVAQLAGALVAYLQQADWTGDVIEHWTGMLDWLEEQRRDLTDGWDEDEHGEDEAED